jgi:hypothetical protein
MEYDLPSILGFLFDNPKWWPAPRSFLQEAELAQDIHDGALATGFGLHRVDVAGGGFAARNSHRAPTRRCRRDGPVSVIWQLPFAWFRDLKKWVSGCCSTNASTFYAAIKRSILAGIDDAHYYRVDNIEKAASEIPDDGFSVLLSHTPEIYRQAAHGGFDLLVSGHTHGGQICLPGSIPITLDSVLPRHMGSGPWKHRDMVGYTSVGVGTSVVPVRINCLPEITLHHLQCSA